MCQIVSDVNVTEFLNCVLMIADLCAWIVLHRARTGIKGSAELAELCSGVAKHCEMFILVVLQNLAIILILAVIFMYLVFRTVILC